MFSVFFKLYNRPGTNVPVGFRTGHTDIPYKVLFRTKGITVDRIFIPASAIIEYSGMYQGDIKPGSEECRFQMGNPDYQYKLYLVADNMSEAQAAHFSKTLSEKLSSSQLFMRA